MHRLDRVPTNEVSVVLDWVNARVTLLDVHEALEGADWLGLRCVSFVHGDTCDNLLAYRSIDKLIIITN